jgi:hypothetical protein
MGGIYDSGAGGDMRTQIVLACVSMLGCAGALAIQGASPTVDWQSILPEVQSAAKKEFRDAGGYYPVSISRVADVTGDGTSEALIDFGCCGAYAHAMTVMRIEEGKPVVALFRGRDGKVASTEFLEGASVMHGAAVELDTTEHAVFSGNWDRKSDGTKLASCGGEAYQWNAAAKRFDYNGRLSERLSKDFCRKIRAQLTAN